MKSVSKRQLRIVIETETTTVIRSRQCPVDAVISQTNVGDAIVDLTESPGMGIAISTQLLKGDIRDRSRGSKLFQE